jgi:Prolyl oligopeptidase, N-terminal beta-propeller domain
MENQPAELASWAKNQSDYTEAMLDKLPGYRQLAERTRALANQYSFISNLKIRNGRLFYVKVANGASQAVLCERDSPSAAERVLADPVRFGTATAHASLASYWPSNDGEHDSSYSRCAVGEGSRAPESPWTHDGKHFLRSRECVAGL